MGDIDYGWYFYCHKDKKREYNSRYYKKHRADILAQKKEYYERKKMDHIKEELKRVEKVVNINNKMLIKLKPIIKEMAKQIGDNSEDVAKIIKGLKEHFDMDFQEKKPHELCEDQKKEINGFYL